MPLGFLTSGFHRYLEIALFDDGSSAAAAVCIQRGAHGSRTEKARASELVTTESPKGIFPGDVASEHGRDPHHPRKFTELSRSGPALLWPSLESCRLQIKNARRERTVTKPDLK